MIEALLLAMPHQTPLPVPTNMSTSTGGAAITPSWTNADATATTRIFRDGVSLATVAAGVVFYTDSSVTPGVTYSYQVRHEKAGRQPSPRSVASSNSIAAAPSAPTGLSATAPYTDRITLNWTNTAAVATNIYRGGVFLASVASGITTYHDDTVAQATAYTYTVRHDDGSLESLDSTSSGATTGTAAFTVVNPTADIATDTILIAFTTTAAMPRVPSFTVDSWSSSSGNTGGGESNTSTPVGIDLGSLGEDIVNPGDPGTTETITIPFFRLRNTAGTVVDTVTDLLLSYRMGPP